MIENIIKYVRSKFPPNFETRFSEILEDIPMPKIHKDIIINRYVYLIVETERKYRHTRFLYFTLTNIINIAGVLMTALLSLDKISIITGERSTLFWVVWALSITITITNKWIHSYNIDKNYIINANTLEKLYSEGWSFICGIGIYAISMDERFYLFCERIEHIKMKSIESMSGLDAVSSILVHGMAAAPAADATATNATDATASAAAGVTASAAADSREHLVPEHEEV